MKCSTYNYSYETYSEKLGYHLNITANKT